MYSSTLSLRSALYGGACSTPRPGRLTPGKTGTDYIGGWVGPRAGLDGCGKSRNDVIEGSNWTLGTYIINSCLKFNLHRMLFAHKIHGDMMGV